MKKLTRGFTLIELLVVISIIGILAALTLTGFNAARKNARDATRKSDLQQYRSALEAYASNNNGKYPAAQAPSNSQDWLQGNGNLFPNNGIFASGGPIIDEYLIAQILPPLSTDVYRYYYRGDGIGWILITGLEGGEFWEICSDGRAGKLTSTNFPQGNDPTCRVL